MLLVFTKVCSRTDLGRYLVMFFLNCRALAANMKTKSSILTN